MALRSKKELKVYRRENMRRWRTLHPTLYKCKNCGDIIGNKNTIKYSRICDKCRLRNCDYCHKEYFIEKCNFAQYKNSRKYCSKSCKVSARNKIIIWKDSSKKILSKKAKQRWKRGRYKNIVNEKSREISRKNNLGRKSHFWIDGRTTLIVRLRSTNKMRDWRNKIFERDDYTCKLCNKKGGYLEADHSPNGFSKLVREYNIKSFREGINCKELWDISNGRTTCKKCHILTDNFGIKGKLSKNQRYLTL